MKIEIKVLTDDEVKLGKFGFKYFVYSKKNCPFKWKNFKNRHQLINWINQYKGIILIEKENKIIIDLPHIKELYIKELSSVSI